jgi:hypothetical protein
MAQSLAQMWAWRQFEYKLIVRLDAARRTSIVEVPGLLCGLRLGANRPILQNSLTRCGQKENIVSTAFFQMYFKMAAQTRPPSLF